MGNREDIQPKPFLKWVGGKSQLLPDLRGLFPSDYNRYFEPFLGGGAVYFDLRPKKAYLNDINAALVATYLTIKKRPRKVISELAKLQESYRRKSMVSREEMYYAIRHEYNQLSASNIKKCIYLVFLNKTGYNGMYRENSKGEFNIPFGKYESPRILDEENLLAASSLLKSAVISSSSFSTVVRKAKRGDLIYFDPPYHPINETSKFTNYSVDGFSETDQIALRDLFIELHRKKCFLMLSNSYTPFVRELYKGFRQETVDANRAINCKASGRGKIKELNSRTSTAHSIRRYSSKSPKSGARLVGHPVL